MPFVVVRITQFLVNVNRQKIVAENMNIILSQTVMFGFFVMPFSYFIAFSMLFYKKTADKLAVFICSFSK